jgi:hypothetical protein
VTGMKWLLGTFSQGWNGRRSRRGHVFQGRYKAMPVSAAMENPYYFRIVADYIHLNPARADLAGGKRGKLVAWKWSSLADYARGMGPGWLVFERVLAAFDLAQDGRGRRAYVAWLEQRATNDKGEIDAEAMKSLRRGWYLGEPSFVDKLRSLVETKPHRTTGADPVARSHDEAGAEELARRALAAVGLPSAAKSLSKLRKGGLEQHKERRVVGKVRSNAWHVCDDIDPEPVQLGLAADTRPNENSRRVDRSCGYDDE